MSSAVISPPLWFAIAVSMIVTSSTLISPTPAWSVLASITTAPILWPSAPFVKVTSSTVAEILSPNVIDWSFALTTISLVAIVQEICFAVTEPSDHV